MFLTKVFLKVHNLQKNKNKPNVFIGDIVNVKVLIKEGNKERLQQYQGTVIAKRGQDIITVRRLFQGIGIEYIFSIFTPQVVSLSIKRKSKVRRSKLFYLRNRIGKRAQLKNTLTSLSI